MFEQRIAGIQMTDAERAQLVSIEEKARYNSVRLAYVAGAVIVLLGLATTPWIKITSPKRSEQESDGEKDEKGEKDLS